MKNLYEVLHTLDSWCEAYPEDMFPEPDPADLKWLHETRRGLCDRISAHMGRHMVKHMREMAEAIRVASEWHPIETAPRDGTEILAWDGYERFVTRWTTFEDGFGAKHTGWIEPNSGELGPYPADPSQWHPLPEAPDGS